MNRVAFLDRDGVLNAAIYNSAEGKLDRPYSLEEFRVLPGAAKAVREVSDMGFLATVVSNKPGVAKGKCSPELLEAMNDRLTATLAEGGARLDGIYYCLHHSEATLPSPKASCDCRKPKPGLLFTSAKERDIDLSRSYTIGDQQTDIEAGLAAGWKTVLVDCHSTTAEPEDVKARPHEVAVDLPAAAGTIQYLEGVGQWRSF